MKSPAPIGHRRTDAFSLVEVTLALGILAFAFVAVFGMLPVGLQTFRDSADKTQTTQIAQRLLADAQQTPFDLLPNLYGKISYFDDEGNLLENATGSTVSGPDGYVYTALIEPASDAVANANDSTIGISKEHIQMIEIRIARNRVVSRSGASNSREPLATFSYAIADVRL